MRAVQSCINRAVSIAVGLNTRGTLLFSVLPSFAASTKASANSSALSGSPCKTKRESLKMSQVKRPISTHRKFWLALSATLTSIGLSACGEGVKTSGSDLTNSTDSTLSASDSRSPPQAKGYDAAAYCATLPQNDLFQVGNGLAFSVGVYIANPDGSKSITVKERNLGYAGLNAGTGFQFDSVDSDFGDVETFTKLLQQNASKELLIECNYGTSAKTLKLRSLQPIASLKAMVAVVSPASEIVYQLKSAYAKSGTPLNLESSYSALEYRYGKLFVRPTLRSEFEGLYTVDEVLVSDKAPAKTAYLALFNLAGDYAISNYEGFAKAVATNFLNGCKTKSLCMHFDRTKSADVSANGNFSAGISGWTKYIDAFSSRAIQVRIGLDSIALIDLSENQSSGRGFSRAELYQDISVSPSSLSNYAVSFNLLSISAGSKFVFGNPVGSGMAGAYVCFSSASADFGCYLAGFHKDIITIPIRIGLAYSLTSTSNTLYELLPNGSGARFLGLAEIVERIPIAQQNSSSITRVRLGLIAADTGAKETDFCNRCFASVQSNRLALEKFK
jgi:hypothetical protein